MTPHLDADLAVTLPDDRPGMLAKAIGCVSAAGINIDGYTEINGVVHVLTEDLPATRKCLGAAGCGLSGRAGAAGGARAGG